MAAGERTDAVLPPPDASDKHIHGRREQEQQRQMVRWERFLPRRSLRVMLVEHDDSTRHVVTALLRKCNYHVASVADGLKAWEILKEKQYKFDLVLTEVEMPSLSGISLLSMIMSCDLSKDIPVIMMSSHDSVNIVYKCMLKGAVDFLVKPVRRNELRNLWQHVWRKHFSTRYGPEGNTIKSGDMSSNNIASNRASANAGSQSKNKGRCDEASDTHSSGSKPEREIQSIKRNREPNLEDQKTSMIEKLPDDELWENESKEHSMEHLGNNLAENGEEVTSVEICWKNLNEKDVLENTSCPETLVQTSQQTKPSKQVIDLISTVANEDCSYAAMEIDANSKRNESKDLETLNLDPLPSWELSLMGPRYEGCSKQDSQERHVLKHSAASAFSRYCAGIPIVCRNSPSASASLSMLIKDHAEKVELRITRGGSDDKYSVPVNPSLSRLSSSHGPEAEDVGCHEDSHGPEAEDVGCHEDSLKNTASRTHSSFENNSLKMIFPSCNLGLASHPFHAGGMPFQSFFPGRDSMVQPVLYHDTLKQGPHVMVENAKQLGPSSHQNPAGYDQSSSNLQKCREGSHSCRVDGRKERRADECTENGVFWGTYTKETNRNCGSYQNYIHVSGSSGSGEMTDFTADGKVATDSGNAVGQQNHESDGFDRDRSRREAALLKFRLKRKDRCFEKKVRYQSRKKLAEQRPRIKGQFVRQSAVESNPSIMEEDD